VKNNRAFTIVELVVVLALMGILAATTVFYGRKWLQQYKISNTFQAAQGAVKVVRMNAISAGTSSLLIFTDAYVSSSIHSSNVQPYDTMFPSATLQYKVGATWDTYRDGNFQLSGPWVWWPVTATMTAPPRVTYFSYNSKLYSFTPAATTITFNAKGFPTISQNQQLVLRSPTTNRTFLLNITPLGKVE
jgi:prepilin-type N-terminal cleavage/methylation domain-containing protein